MNKYRNAPGKNESSNLKQSGLSISLYLTRIGYVERVVLGKSGAAGLAIWSEEGKGRLSREIYDEVRIGSNLVYNNSIFVV